MPRSPFGDLGTPDENNSYNFRLRYLMPAPVLCLRLSRSRSLAIVLVRAACGKHPLELLLLGVVQERLDPAV